MWNKTLGINPNSRNGSSKVGRFTLETNVSYLTIKDIKPSSERAQKLTKTATTQPAENNNLTRKGPKKN